MKQTIANYSDKQVQYLKDNYNPEDTQEQREAQVAQAADFVGKTRRSVIAKLVSLKLYVPKVNGSVTKTVVRKSDLVAIIASKLGVEEDVIGSLEKATKNALSLIASRLTAE